MSKFIIAMLVVVAASLITSAFVPLNNSWQQLIASACWLVAGIIIGELLQ